MKSCTKSGRSPPTQRFDWHVISRFLKDSGWGFKPTLISKKHVIAWERGFSRRFALTLRELCVSQLCTVLQIGASGTPVTH